MKISVVTPNFNYGRFLRKALESVLAQVSGPESAPDACGVPLEVEHLVIDGGSTDGSVALLKEWAAKAAALPPAVAARYSFSFVSEPDGGQTDAINKGLRRATGDLVCWLNADEYYLPGKLPLVVREFARRPDTDFLYGEPLFVREDGSPIRVKWDHPFSRFVLLFGGCVISSCAAFWRRHILEKGIFLDVSFRMSMDYEYYCRLCRDGFRFRFLPTTIAAFCWHDANASILLQGTNGNENHRVWLKYAPVFQTMKSTTCLKIGYSIARFFRRILIGYRLVFLPIEKIEPEKWGGRW